MSKLPRIGLLALFAILLHCGQLGLVEATCGHCYGSHSCIDNTTAQLCFDGVPHPDYIIKCPEDQPICSRLGQMCVSADLGIPPACGDTAGCDQCGNGQLFACTSQVSFGLCQDEELINPYRSKCPDNYFCSVAGAAAGEPCVMGCEPDGSDSCDREPESNDTTTTTTESPSTPSSPITPSSPSTPTSPVTPSSPSTPSSPITPSSPSTPSSPNTPSSNSTESNSTESTSTTSTTSTSTAPTPIDASAFCQSTQRVGRFVIPSDTVILAASSIAASRPAPGRAPMSIAQRKNHISMQPTDVARSDQLSKAASNANAKHF